MPPCAPGSAKKPNVVLGPRGSANLKMAPFLGLLAAGEVEGTVLTGAEVAGIVAGTAAGVLAAGLGVDEDGAAEVAGGATWVEAAGLEGAELQLITNNAKTKRTDKEINTFFTIDSFLLFYMFLMKNDF